MKFILGALRFVYRSVFPLGFIILLAVIYLTEREAGLAYQEFVINDEYTQKVLRARERAAMRELFEEGGCVPVTEETVTQLQEEQFLNTRVYTMAVTAFSAEIGRLGGNPIRVAVLTEAIREYRNLIALYTKVIEFSRLALGKGCPPKSDPVPEKPA